MNWISAVSVYHFCHFLSKIGYKKTVVKCSCVYNSLIYVLFNCGQHYPQQIVAKNEWVVNEFFTKMECFLKRGLGMRPYGNSYTTDDRNGVDNFACVMTQAVLAILTLLVNNS